MEDGHEDGCREDAGCHEETKEPAVFVPKRWLNIPVQREERLHDDDGAKGFSDLDDDDDDDEEQFDDVEERFDDVDDAELSLEEDELLDDEFAFARGGATAFFASAHGDFPILRELQANSEAAVLELRTLVKDALRRRRARVSERVRARAAALAARAARVLERRGVVGREVLTPKRLMRRTITGDESVRVRDLVRREGAAMRVAVSAAARRRLRYARTVASAPTTVRALDKALFTLSVCTVLLTQYLLLARPELFARWYKNPHVSCSPALC